MTNSSLNAIAIKTEPGTVDSCWSCGTMRAAHFCESCGKVQPPAPSDYFRFFGLTRKLNVDVPAHLATLAKELGFTLFFISTGII